MPRLRHTLRLLPALLLIFTLLGCDSGGGNGDSLSDLSLEVEGPSGTQVSLSQTFFYSEGGGFCVAARAGAGVGSPQVPVDQSVEAPNSVNCDSDPEDFDGVRISVSPLSGGSPDLTVRLLSDGDTIDETTSPTSTGGVERWVVEAGEVRDLGSLSREKRG